MLYLFFFFKKKLIKKMFIGAGKVIISKANHVISANYLFSINQKSTKMSFYSFKITKSTSTSILEFEMLKDMVNESVKDYIDNPTLDFKVIVKPAIRILN